MRVLMVAPIGDNFNIADSGYAMASNGIYNCLKRMEEEKLIEKVDYISTIEFKDKRVEEKYDLALVNVHPNSFLNKITAETFFSVLKNVEKRYFHVVWETTPLPSSWEFLWKTDFFTGFFTPSKFVLNQIKKHSNKHSFYLPHYIDTNQFSSLDVQEKLDKEQKFSVLFVGQNTKRKGIEDALVSFIRSLGEKEDTQLVLKYHNLSRVDLPIENRIQHFVQTNCIEWKSSIYTLSDKLSQYEMTNLYRDSSILLMPTRGEGFGLPLIEAMSVGIPIICTGWSSCSEVLEGSYGNTEVGFTLDSSVGMTHHGYERGSKYALPLISDIENALLNKYNQWKRDKKEYYSEVVENRNIVNEKYGYEAIKKYLTSIIEGSQNE